MAESATNHTGGFMAPVLILDSFLAGPYKRPLRPVWTRYCSSGAGRRDNGGGLRRSVQGEVAGEEEGLPVQRRGGGRPLEAGGDRGGVGRRAREGQQAPDDQGVGHLVRPQSNRKTAPDA